MLWLPKWMKVEVEPEPEEAAGVSRRTFLYLAGGTVAALWMPSSDLIVSPPADLDFSTMRIPVRQLYGRIEFSAEALQEAAANPGAWIRMLKAYEDTVEENLLASRYGVTSSKVARIEKGVGGWDLREYQPIGDPYLADD